MADAAAIWLKACELGRGDSPPAEFSTLRTSRSNLKHHILPAIGKVKLAHLTRANVAAFRDHLLTKLSRVMAKKVLTSFKGILSEADARGYVVGNVASSVRIGTKGRHKEPVTDTYKGRSEIHHGEAGRVSNGQAVAAMARPVCYRDP